MCLITFRRLVASLMVAGSLAVVNTGYGAAPQAPFDIQFDNYVFDAATGQTVAEGDVIITSNGLELRADKVVYNSTTLDVAAEGNVIFKRGVFTWQGPAISGNFKTKEFAFNQSRGMLGVWYYRTRSGKSTSDGNHEFGETLISTCDHLADPDKKPHYCLSCKKIEHHDDGSYTARHLVAKIGRVPIFYLPYWKGSSREDGRGSSFDITAGYDSDWGAHIGVGKKWRFGDGSSTRFYTDYRTKRGWAFGNETAFNTKNSRSDFLVYGMKDKVPPTTDEAAGLNRRFDVVENRYRVKFTHQYRFNDRLSLKLNLDKFSDIDFLEDWFDDEHDDNPQPRSFAELAYEGDRFQLALTARARVNDFFTVVERLPELRLTVPRQPVGEGRLHYESSSTASYLQRRWRDYGVIRTDALINPLDDPEDYRSWRADTLHVLTLPMDMGKDIRFIPRAGLRLTYYSETSDGDVTSDDLNMMFEVDDPDINNSTLVVNNYDKNGGSKVRLAGEIGFELSTKFFKVWQDHNSAFWQTDGLRHVVQPYLNYTYAPEPSTDRDNLYFFDEVDRLTEQNFVRVGVRQRWQTRRKRSIYTIATLDAYADFHFAKEDDHNHGGDLGIVLNLTPRDTFKIKAFVLTDMGDGTVDRAGISARLGDPKRFLATLAYSYQNDFTSRTLYSMTSSLENLYAQSWLGRRYDKTHTLTLGAEFPLGPKTAARLRYSYDLEDGEEIRKSCELIRDLHCWMGSLGIEEDEDSMSLMLWFYLKADPDFSLHSSL